MASDAGAAAALTADNPYLTNLDLATRVAPAVTNVLAFTIATESGATYPINLSQAAWNTTAGTTPLGTNPVSFGAVTINEIVGQLNTQIARSATGNNIANAEVEAVNNAGRIEFRVRVPPAANGDFVRIADNAPASTTLRFN